MKRATAQMALEALKLAFGRLDDRNAAEIEDCADDAMAALEADLAQPVEPMFWVRLCSDGCYEGPIHNSAIERVRKESGGWTPLYTTPPEPAGWQPIAMAPKDGTSMLVYNSRMVVEAWFSLPWNKFVQADIGGSNNLNPTHWMPLPSAPKDAT